jgi:hypothetical protein
MGKLEGNIMKKYKILFLTTLVFLAITPLLISLIINRLYNTAGVNFSKETWLSFMGSYIGAIVTAGVLFFTIQYNKRMLDSRIIEEKIKQQYIDVKDTANKLIDMVLLTKYESMENRGRDIYFYERIFYDIMLIRSIIHSKQNNELYDLILDMTNKYEGLIPKTATYSNTQMTIDASSSGMEVVINNARLDLYEKRDKYFEKLNENMEAEIKTIYL